jgi:hypothetical protein
VLPTAEQMTANTTTVASGDFFSNQMKQMIWPTYGQQSPIPGTDVHGNLDDYSYPWNNHIYPDDARFEALGYDMSNLTAQQQERVIRDRVSFVGGKYGGVSGTYHDDNHFLDITYGTARSIDEASFDIVAGAIYNWDDPNEWPELQHLDLGPGWGWEYDSSPGNKHSLTKEHWQYQENGEDFHVSHLEDIIGVTFPERLHTKYRDGGEIFKEYLQPGGFEHDLQQGDPGINDVNYASGYNECSAHKKIIQNAHAGDVITFDYRIASDQWDNEGGYDITGSGNGPYYDSFSDEPNDLYVVAGKRVMLAWSMFRELPDEEVTDEYGFVLTNPNSPVDTGTFSYTIQQEDINPVTGALDFVTAYHADDINFHRVSITNFAINEGDRTRAAAGQLGKTTDAYNLGASVASLNPNNKKKKKKDEEEETNKSVTAKNSKEQEQTQSQEPQQKDTETEDTFTKRGKTYDKGAYSVLGAYTPSVEQVELYYEMSDIKGQTEPPEPGTKYYTWYYRSFVPKEESNSEYKAWLSSIPKEQADKIRNTKQKADPAANQRYVGKFQMFGKPKLYGKYGDTSYYNPVDTGQEVSNQVKIKWNDLGEPLRQDRFGQRLANPGERQDSYGFPLSDDMEESDYTYWKGKRYLKGSYADTAEIDPETGRFRGTFSWFAEKDPASAKTGNSDKMSTTNNWEGPRAAWEYREFVGLGPNEEIEKVIQYRKHYDLMREKYGRLRDIPKQYHKNNNFLESLNRLVVATMPKDWARPFVPADDDMPVDDEPLDIEDFENKSDYDAYKAGGGDAARKNGMSVDDIIAQGRKNLKSLDNDDPYHLNLGYAFKEALKGIKDLSSNFKKGVDSQIDGLLDALKSLALNGSPAANYATDIAKSILSNKPIVKDQADIPEFVIDALVNGIQKSEIHSGNMKVTDTPINYSDENFYVDDSGKVNAHTPETLEKYPNNTGPVGKPKVYGGLDNPLAAAGQAQVQFVYPSDGSEPYMQYTDHAYHNLDSKDPGEVPDPVKKGLSHLVHATAGYGKDKVQPGTKGQYDTMQLDTTTPNTGDMKGYPPNIRGDVVTNVKVPVKDLPQNLKDALKNVTDNPTVYHEHPINQKITEDYKNLPRDEQDERGGEVDESWINWIKKLPKNKLFENKNNSPYYEKKLEIKRANKIEREKRKQELALELQKIKNRSKWSQQTEPNPNALYPGQPSPNGFPDTPPPEMINGYHPEFGKQAKRYRKLDPISAKTMSMVGTDDPQTNKQVAAAAADSKPKKLPPGAAKKYAKRNVVKKESNNLYTRSRKYIDMNHVKEIREEKIKREKIAEILRQQKEILAELVEIEAEQSKYVDWRKGDINEQMTTAGLGMINYPAEGDVDLEDISNKVTALGSNPGYSESGNTYTFGPVVNPGENPRGSSLVLSNLDARKYDTISFNFSAGTIDEFQMNIGGTVSTYNLSPQSGRKTITLRSSDRVSGLSIAFLIFNDRNGNDLPVGTNIISNLSFQRRTPVNVFVSLDDPEANSFVRDGTTDKVSNKEKKKRLEEQLASSKEYLNKMFGEGMPNTATTIADYEPQKSYTEIASIYQSPDGTYQSFPGSVNPNKDTSKWPSINDKPKPVKWPTPGIFPGQLPRV